MHSLSQVVVNAARKPFVPSFGTSFPCYQCVAYGFKTPKAPLELVTEWPSAACDFHDQQIVTRDMTCDHHSERHAPLHETEGNHAHG